MLHLCLVIATQASGLSCKFDSAGLYNCTSGGSVIFTSAPVAAFVGQKWLLSGTSLKKLTHADELSGSDKMGAFVGGFCKFDAGGVPLVTSIKNYGTFTIFTSSFPEGALGTNNTRAAYHGVSVNFPAFTETTATQLLSWAGSFMPPQLQSTADVFKGSDSGLPAVFFSSTTAASGTYIVSALDHFFAASTSSTLADGSKGWTASTSGTITQHDKGFSHSFVLMAAGGAGGLTQSMFEYGQLMQKYVDFAKYPKIPDITLEKIGYQTDNGGMYTFCPHWGNGTNCDQV